MQDIGEITEIAVDDQQTQNKDKVDEIEVGLEIVALEMGRILEELKENLEKIPWEAVDVQIEKSQTLLKQPIQKKVNSITSNETSISTLFSNNTLKPKQTVELKCTKSFNRNPSNKIQKQAISSREQNTEAKSKNKKNEQNCIDRPNYQVQRKSYSANNEKHLHGHTTPFDKVVCGNSNSSRSHSPDMSLCDSGNNSINRGRSTPNSSKSKECSNTRRQNLSQYAVKNQPLVYTNLLINDPLAQLCEKVEVAIRDKKTFTVCGNYYTIRRAMLARGWIEKLRILYNTYNRNNLKKLESMSISELFQNIDDSHKGYIYKRMIMSKLLEKHQVDFYWDQHYDAFRINPDNIKLTIINRFKRGAFSYTSKQSLCEAMKSSYWYYKPGFSYIRHPRSYNLSNSGDPKDFINDFKITAATSLLKWIVNQQDTTTLDKITSSDGKVPFKIYHFAVSELLKVVRKCKHEDIDFEIEDAMDYEWNEFLEAFYKVVHVGCKFKSDPKKKYLTILNEAKKTLKKLDQYWPHLSMDGIMNIWILKPTLGSRGDGIYLCRTLQYVLKTIKSNITRRYIVQKYIERPLLIYNTKFDIRQWFLISNVLPFTVWIYKDCYIRFSSQIYTLHKLHESIHLTNNSVQCKYANCTRNQALPNCNMWDSAQFTKYLEKIGHPDVFRKIIYPGMKECLTAAILMNNSIFNMRRNSFELYGSDFMITEDFLPWLIEINSRPALYPSTPITARLCPKVLDDVIKVVIDYPKNHRASTGNFELLYQQQREMIPNIENDSLNLVGTHLCQTYFYSAETKEQKNITQTKQVVERKQATKSINDLYYISSDIKKALESLLKLIQTERNQRKQKTHERATLTEVKSNESIKELNCPEQMITVANSDSKLSIKKVSLIETKSSGRLCLDSSKEKQLTTTNSTTKILIKNLLKSIKKLSVNCKAINQT